MGTSEAFEYTVKLRDGFATVEVRGEVDAFSGPSLADAVMALTSDGLSRIVIDLEHVTFIDSKGLSALLLSHRSATENDIVLTVEHLQPAVERLFRISGVDAVLVDPDRPG